jgi:hypothetical protein
MIVLRYWGMMMLERMVGTTSPNTTMEMMTRPCDRNHQNDPRKEDKKGRSKTFEEVNGAPQR